MAFKRDDLPTKVVSLAFSMNTKPDLSDLIKMLLRLSLGVVLTLSLSGCAGANSQHDEVSAPTTVTIPSAAVSEQPTRRSTTRPLVQTIQPQHKYIVEGSLRIDRQRVSRLLIDDDAVFWMSDNQPTQFFRYPRKGGQISVVATSSFADGNLGVIPPLRLGDWFVFLDTHERIYTEWIVRGTHLKTGEQKLFFKRDSDEQLLYPPRIYGDDDWLIWVSQLPATNGCSPSQLRAFNLQTSQTRLMDSGCAESDYVWSHGMVADVTVVAERVLPKQRGGGTEIVQFDLTTDDPSIVIASGNQLNGPVISNSFVVWALADRTTWAQAAHIQDRATAHRFDQKLPAEFSYLGISGDWLYWASPNTNPLQIFNMRSKTLLSLAIPDNNEKLDLLHLHNHAVAWVRYENWGQFDKLVSVIEWSNLPS
jgi:hypothetical protein